MQTDSTRLSLFRYDSECQCCRSPSSFLADLAALSSCFALFVSVLFGSPVISLPLSTVALMFHYMTLYEPGWLGKGFNCPTPSSVLWANHHPVFLILMDTASFTGVCKASGSGSTVSFKTTCCFTQPQSWRGDGLLQHANTCH